MGLRQTFREALDETNRIVRISEQGFSSRLTLTASEFHPDAYTTGELSAQAREEYQRGKAERGPADRPGLEEWLG